MKKNVVFFSNPFGFGPTAKTIALINTYVKYWNINLYYIANSECMQIFDEIKQNNDYLISDLLVNVSGCMNPLTKSCPESFLILLAESLRQVKNKKILVCGGSEAINFMKQYLQNENIICSTLKKDVFLSSLLHTKHFLKTAGLNATLEAFTYKIPTGFIMPTNLSQWKNLITQTQKLNLTNKIIFTGSLSLPDLITYLKNALVHVCPSRVEGDGIINVQASACGCIPIGSNIDGIPEYIKDKRTGLLFNVDDAVDLSIKIKELLKNKKLYQKLKKEGLSFAQTFDIPNIAQQYLDIYKNSCIPEAITPWSDKIQKMCEVI